MSNEIDSSERQEKQKYAIALPCNPDQFGEFISSLLGKPQTIANAFSGSFEVDHKEVENVFQLVNQRITQQNDSSLIQFTVKIVYNDNSTVLLNSIDDFRTYAEVRPLISTQLHLSWSFLVKFQDRDVPEKQEIELSFDTNSHQSFSVFDSDGTTTRMARLFGGGGYISFRIRHTARTWGADLESLLSGHVKHVLVPQSKVRGFLRRHSGKVAFAIALTFFLGSVIACFYSANQVSAVQLASVNELIQQGADITSKVDALLATSSSGFWGKYFFSLFVFVIFSFCLSILFAVWAETSADTNQPSYILLTKKSEQNKVISDKKYERRWFSFLASVVVSIATGLIANLIFTSYWA